MKKTDTWMPLYIGDYLADTSRLTTEQHGAYLLLLMDYWRNGPPPDDEAVLASIAKLSIAQWRRHEKTLRSFFTVENGEWLQGRADIERAKANGVSSTRSVSGKAGANARWGDSKQDGKRIANGIANGVANAQQSDAPSQSQSQEKEKPPATRVPLWSPPHWIPLESWLAFVAMRKAKGRRAPFTDAARDGVVAALEILRSCGHDIGDVLQASVVNGWSGVFAPRVVPISKNSQPADLDDMFRRGVA